MPPGFKVVFSATAGRKNIFPVVTGNVPFFETTGYKNIFPVVKSNVSFFETTGYKTIFPGVTSNNVFLETTGVTSVFPVVQPLSTSKLLKLKFGDFDLATNNVSVTAFDDTGEYSVSNPNGYNPEADAPNVNRAKRSEVDLYLAYRVWKNGKEIPNTNFPATINPTLNPWEYTLTIEEMGVYQMYMIAAPLDKTYEYVQGRGNSIFEFATNEQGWYATQSVVIIDDDIINCINKHRYKFLESVMCGDCNEGYLQMYGLFVGALNAFEIGTDEAMLQGMTMLDQLKEECNKEDCKCNC